MGRARTWRTTMKTRHNLRRQGWGHCLWGHRLRPLSCRSEGCPWQAGHPKVIPQLSSPHPCPRLAPLLLQLSSRLKYPLPPTHADRVSRQQNLNTNLVSTLLTLNRDLATGRKTHHLKLPLQRCRKWWSACRKKVRKMTAGGSSSMKSSGCSHT